MKTVFYGILISILTCCNPSGKPLDTHYIAKFDLAKTYYPFDKWRASYNDGLIQYTAENCGRAKKIIDDLIDGLVREGEDAPTSTKEALFKEAILKFNKLDAETEHTLIETGEREDLCELLDQITIASGLRVQEQQVESLVDQWREW